MFRMIAKVIWLSLSAWLVIWAAEGLFGVDQRSSILSFHGTGDSLIAPIMIGVIWGMMLTFG